jgi:hypothetical protein
MTEAHDHTVSLRIVEHTPAHEPREGDPHFMAFRAARRRLKAAGLLRCVVCGSTGTPEQPIELHHSRVEFSFQNGVDVGKLNELYGLHLDDASFADWINSPGNCEPLCVTHHRGLEAVHLLPEPVWNAVRVWRDDLPPVAEAHGNI